MEATSKIPSEWSLRENTESVLEAAIQTGDEPGKSLGSPWRYHPNGWKLIESYCQMTPWCQSSLGGGGMKSLEARQNVIHSWTFHLCIHWEQTHSTLPPQILFLLLGLAYDLRHKNRPLSFCRGISYFGECPPLEDKWQNKMTIVPRYLMLLPKFNKYQLTEVPRQYNEDEEVETKPCFQTLALRLSSSTWPAITDACPQADWPTC